MQMEADRETPALQWTWRVSGRGRRRKGREGLEKGRKER
jgi:hypothetical protein